MSFDKYMYPQNIHGTACVWNECSCTVIWTFFGIAFLWNWNETDLFQSCDHCWVFQICWYIEFSTFKESFLRIWESSTWIPSPPLALFIVILPKAHFTSHSRMSGSRWLIAPSWLLGHEDLFYTVLPCSCHLFLISSASVRSTPFLSFIKPVLHEMFPWYL